VTLAEYIDRKRQLEVEIAHSVEVAVLVFESQTGTTVAEAKVSFITPGLWTSAVEVRL